MNVRYIKSATVVIEHNGIKETYDRVTVLASLDPRLMDMILSRKANWNNAEIGSHIQLYDFIPESNMKMGRQYEAMPHHLMSYFQEPLKSPLKQMALTGV